MVEKKIGTICVASEKHSKIKYLFSALLLLLSKVLNMQLQKIVF